MTTLPIGSTAAGTANGTLPPSTVRREAIVRPLGLVTQPNKMGQYPAGALKSAVDCFMRQPGVLESSRVKFDFQATGQAGSPNFFSAIVIPSDNDMLQLFNANTIGAWEWFNFSGFNAATLSGGIQWPVDGRCTWTRSRDRFIVNSLQALMTFDYATPINNAQRTPRLTGLAPPVIDCIATSGTANAIPQDKHCTVVAIIRRTYQPDGYQLVSGVSTPADSGFNHSGAQDISIVIVVPPECVAGDVVEIYRTRVQTAGTGSGGGIGGVSCDATYFLTTTHALTSADIIAGGVSIVDSTPDTGFGAELYTNPGQGGGYATRLLPPLAKVLATFKGYTFAFNTTEVAQQVLSILGGIGTARNTLFDPPAWRANLIGGRAFTATCTPGNATVTGVAAGDIVGLRVGQQASVGFASIAKVIAIGASTVTFSIPTTLSGTVQVLVYDVITINGADCPYINLSGLYAALSGVARAAWATSHTLIQAASLAYFSSVYDCAPSAPIFSIARAYVNDGSITLAATNGQNYQPALPEYGATPLTVTTHPSTNAYAWTEEQQPEAWSVSNRARVGSSDIVAAAATRDALWIFTQRNGLWRLYGNGGAVGAEGFDWQVDPVDSTLSIAGPQAWCVLRDVVYAYTNRGLVAISDDGIDDTLSQGVINDLLPGPFYSLQNLIQVRADEENDEIWVWDGTHAYVWSFLAKAWVQNTQLAPSVANGNYTTQFWPNVKSMVIVDDNAARARYFNAAFDSFVQMSWDYQPLYFEDPFATKQWVDTTWVFTNEFAEKFIPYVQTIVRFNGQSYFGNVAPVSNGADARVTYMVPRNSPAIGNAICPGILVFGSLSNTPPRFEGLSMRATIIGEQQTRRNT